jgi:shikimate kinase
MSQDDATPGLRPSLTDNALETEVAETLAFRTPLYKGASHMEIDTDLADPGEIAATIKRRLENGR